MKINCVIIDDEPLAREGIRDYIGQVAFLNLTGEFKSALEAETFIAENPVDLMFLDINMPKKSGLDFVKSLTEPPKVIFITAYREFASESYDLDGLDYLVKPIAFERFFKAVNKAYNFFETNEPPIIEDHFFVKVDGVIKKILTSELLFIEGMKDYVKIHCKDKPPLITLVSLKQMEQQLPEYFMRVHRSYIVATNKVEEIEGNVLKIEDNDIPMAPQLRNAVMEKVMGGKYLKR